MGKFHNAFDLSHTWVWPQVKTYPSELLLKLSEKGTMDKEEKILDLWGSPGQMLLTSNPSTFWEVLGSVASVRPPVPIQVKFKFLEVECIQGICSCMSCKLHESQPLSFPTKLGTWKYRVSPKERSYFFFLLLKGMVSFSISFSSLLIHFCFPSASTFIN